MKTYEDGLTEALKISRDYAERKRADGKGLTGDSYRRFLYLVDAAEYIEARIEGKIIEARKSPVAMNNDGE